MVEPIINDATQEVGYGIQRISMFAVGKQLAHTAGHNLGEATEQLLGMSAREASNNTASLGGAFTGLGGVMVIGLSAAVSSALVQMDYVHRKDNLAQMYKEEISAKLGKPADKVKASDLEELAKQNQTIKEDLKRSQKQRNYGLGLSFIASMASLAAITIALPAIAAALPALGIGALLSAPAWSGAAIGGVFLKAAIGIITYNTVKAPLHALADKLFDIDKTTVNDHIVGIQREHSAGKAVTRAQVFSVFVAAHPELSQHIISEYGKAFDSLNPAMQDQIAAEANNFIPLDKYTIAINSGAIKATELAFAVEGDISGVDGKHPDPEKKKGVIGKLFKGMVKVDLPSTKTLVQAEAYSSTVDASPVMAIVHASQAELEQVSEKPEKGSHVSRLGLARKEPHLSHVQQLEQASNDPTASLGLPT